MNEYKKEQIKDLLCEGLSYDGGHHKQYCLEEVFKLIFGIEELEDFKKANYLDDGIPA